MLRLYKNVAREEPGEWMARESISSLLESGDTDEQGEDTRMIREAMG